MDRCPCQCGYAGIVLPRLRLMEPRAVLCWRDLQTPKEVADGVHSPVRGAAGDAPGPDQPPGFPFRGPGLLVRVVPFAVVAVLAEASLALPVGVQSQPAMIVSIVLLLAVAGSFALPWRRLPAWTTVLVPLAYTGRSSR